MLGNELNDSSNALGFQVGRLQFQVRLLTSALAISWLLAGFLVCGSSRSEAQVSVSSPVTTPSKVIEAQQLILRDSQGRSRIEMEATDRGSSIVFNSDSGRKILDLGDHGGYGQISVADSNSTMTCSGNGIRIEAPDSTPRVVLSSIGYSGGLTFYAARPETQRTARIREELKRLNDPANMNWTSDDELIRDVNRGVRLESELSGSTKVSPRPLDRYPSGFVGEQQGASSTAPLRRSEELPRSYLVQCLMMLASEGGRTHLTLNDSEGRSRAVLGAVQLVGQHTDIKESRPEGSLVLFDDAGKVLWSIP